MSIGNFSFLLGEGELVKKALTILKCSIFFCLFIIYLGNWICLLTFK